MYSGRGPDPRLVLGMTEKGLVARGQNVGNAWRSGIAGWVIF